MTRHQQRNAFFVLLTSAILGIGLPQAATAVDLAVKAPIYIAPIAVPVYNWTGFYAGGNIGGAWSNSTLADSNAGVSVNPGGAGFIGGLQTGYNLQAGNLVYGIGQDLEEHNWANGLV
jgi:outer membrane immunogenic protein